MTEADVGMPVLSVRAEAAQRDSASIEYIASLKNLYERHYVDPAAYFTYHHAPSNGRGRLQLPPFHRPT